MNTMHTTIVAKSLSLEKGGVLQNVEVKWFGPEKLDFSKKVVWVSHALTADANVLEWWAGVLNQAPFNNSDTYQIICPNVLGSCYGTTGPMSLAPKTQQPYLHSFPEITIRDLAKVQQLLMHALEIPMIDLLIGPSLGGQQALEMAYELKNKVAKMVLIATNAQHSPWGVAFNESQRMAIEADLTWKENKPNAGLSGLEAARAMALLSYRSYDTYQRTQARSTGLSGHEPPARYQRYQGMKLRQRFNAFSYWVLSKAMDSHDVGRGRNGVSNALKSINTESIVIGIEEDVLFPIQEQQFLAQKLPNAAFVPIHSTFGHDGFLKEQQTILSILRDFINKGVQCFKSIQWNDQRKLELPSVH